MMEEFNYISYKGNENLIQEYFNSIFFFRKESAIDILKQFSQLKGYCINDYEACYFANQFSPEDMEEYFGEEGVLFDYTAPYVPEDCAIILTYEEFYQVAEDRYQKFARTHLDKRDEIMRLLECLRTAITSRSEYVKRMKNEGLIQVYFNTLFFYRSQQAIDVLKRFCQLTGYVINDYLACYFTIEYPDKDSKEGVLFDFRAPYVPKDRKVLLTYEEFYKVVRDRYEELARWWGSGSENEIMQLLECLKTAISDVTGHS